MAKEIKLTQESLDAYKDELEYLKTTRADEVAEQLKESTLLRRPVRERRVR